MFDFGVMIGLWIVDCGLWIVFCFMVVLGWDCFQA